MQIALGRFFFYEYQSFVALFFSLQRFFEEVV